MNTDPPPVATPRVNPSFLFVVIAGAFGSDSTNELWSALYCTCQMRNR